MTTHQYIIGLGSNLGNRFQNLTQAISQLETFVSIVRISPLYESSALLTDLAEASWNKNYLNAAILIETQLLPEELLSRLKNIELALKRDLQAPRWSPRTIDLDILFWKDRAYETPHLIIPHREVCNRAFALVPAAHIAPDWIHPIDKKTLATLSEQFNITDQKPIKILPHRLSPPWVMGIINLTPDSFSDGDPEQTIEDLIGKIDLLVDNGANIIDLGAESTRPGAELISEKEEWQRLEPILKIISSRYQNHIIFPQISLDTRRAAIAEKSLSYSFDIINDVSAFSDTRMLPFIRESKKSIIFMHQLGLPAGQKYLDKNIPVIPHLIDFAKEKIRFAMNSGLTQKQLIFDPGIGFGKVAEQSIAILKNFSMLDELGIPICLGYSRKRFLNYFLPLPANQRDFLTHLVTSQCMRKHSNYLKYLRVHDVSGTLQALQIAEEIK